MTPVEKEIEADNESWLERTNRHLEKLLEKANKEKMMLRHTAYHYLARNKICKARIRTLKAKLRRNLKRKKDQDRHNIVLDAGHSVKISRNLAHFLSILNFWRKKQDFLPGV